MSLDQAYQDIWNFLAASAHEEHGPCSAVQVATIGLDGAPGVRSVMLRYVSEPDNLVVFHTDRRSPKIQELHVDPRVSLVALDAPRNFQVRITGEANVVLDEEVRRQAWQASPDHELTVFRTRLAPGTPVADPDDAFRGSHAANDKGADEEGFEHFCVVEIRPRVLDYLKHSPGDRHERARFIREGGGWTSSWIAP